MGNKKGARGVTVSARSPKVRMLDGCYLVVSRRVRLLNFDSPGLDDALSDHGVGYLHEAGDVGSLHVVDKAVGLGAVLYTLCVDVAHDFVETVVDLLGTPLEMLGVLAHFET